MIISSTSAFHFLKFKNIIFLYICLCGLYMSNAPWHDISHTHVSVLKLFWSIIDHLLNLTTRSRETRYTSKLLLGN